MYYKLPNVHPHAKFFAGWGPSPIDGRADLEGGVGQIKGSGDGSPPVGPKKILLFPETWTKK